MYKNYKKIESCLLSLGQKVAKFKMAGTICYGWTAESAYKYDIRICCSDTLLRISARKRIDQPSPVAKLLHGDVDMLNKSVPLIKFVQTCSGIECRLEAEYAWVRDLDDQGLKHMILLPIAAMDFIGGISKDNLS